MTGATPEPDQPELRVMDYSYRMSEYGTLLERALGWLAVQCWTLEEWAIWKRTWIVVARVPASIGDLAYKARRKLLERRGVAPGS